MAGLATLECVIEEREIPADDLLGLQLVENCLRDDLKPVEQARAYRRLLDARGWNMTQLADELNLHQTTVSRSLALLDLPEAVQDQVERGSLPPSAAAEIAKLESVADQVAVAEAVEVQGLGPRRGGRAGQGGAGPPTRSEGQARADHDRPRPLHGADPVEEGRPDHRDPGPPQGDPVAARPGPGGGAGRLTRGSLLASPPSARDDDSGDRRRGRGRRSMADDRAWARKLWKWLVLGGFFGVAVILYWVVFSTATPETPTTRSVSGYLLLVAIGLVVVGVLGDLAGEGQVRGPTMKRPRIRIGTLMLLVVIAARWPSRWSYRVGGTRRKSPPSKRR